MSINADGLDGYEIQETIGRGGFATVHRALDTRHSRNVAIKVINGQLNGDEQRRFDRERQVIGQLANHPNVVPVFDSGYSPDGEAYIVLEYESGGAFSDRLAASGALGVDEALQHIDVVAGAVEAAHRLGIRHRDIKPENILIDEYGIPKLTDFGIASVSSEATTTGVASATLAHCAPETLDGVKPTDAVDIYSLASTFHHLVSGSPAFVRPGEEGIGGLVRRVLTDAPPSLEPFGVSAPVDAVIKQAMAKRPEDRQSSVSQFRTQLAAAAAAGPGASSAPPGGAGAVPGGGAGTVGPPTIAFDGVLPIEAAQTPQPAESPHVTPSPIPTEPPTIQQPVQPDPVPAAQPAPAAQPTSAPVQHTVQPVEAAPPDDEARSRGWLILVPVLLVMAVAAAVLFVALRPDGNGSANPAETTGQTDQEGQGDRTTTEAEPLATSAEGVGDEAVDTDPPVTARPPAATGSTAAPTTAEESPAPDPVLFRSPSGNIVCQITSEVAYCEIEEHSWTAPADPSCDLDSGNTLYVNAAEVGFLCAGDTIRGLPAVTLEYGTAVTVGSFTCWSERTGVTCRNGATVGFSVARAAYELLGAAEPASRQTLGAASCSPGGVIVFGGSTDRFDILLCEKADGGLEYHGAEPAKDLEIRLSACQLGTGRWRAENEGFLYLVISDDTVAGTTIQVLDPDDEEILLETFNSLVGDTGFRLEYAC